MRVEPRVRWPRQRAAMSPPHRSGLKCYERVSTPPLRLAFLVSASPKRRFDRAYQRFIHRPLTGERPSLLPRRATAYFLSSFAHCFITLLGVFPVETSI